MWLIDWFNTVLKKPIYTKSGEFLYSESGCEVEQRFFVKHLAVNAAVNLIKNTLAQAEFKTYEKGKPIKAGNYYLFNVEPNTNYNASRFWGKVIDRIVWDNEALVIQCESDGMLYAADKFKVDQFPFKKNLYHNIWIDDKELAKVYYEDEILHFMLHNKHMRSVIDGLYLDYGNLIEYSKNTYKRSNARRGILNIPSNYPQDEVSQAQLNKLLDSNFKKFFETETGAVLPLSNGLTYNDLTNQTYKNGSDSRDIRALIDDIFDYVAIAFQIPPQLLKGNVADSDNSWDNFMTFCINPIAEIIEDEVNRKIYGKDGYMERTYLKVDTTRIRQRSLEKMANAIDILTRNGVNTLDDNLELVGREPIGGAEGQTRMYTKNLGGMEDVKGGE